MVNKKHILITLSIIISLIICYFLFKQINLNDIVQSFSKIPISYIIIAFAIYVISMLFVAIKFHIILNKKIKFNRLMFIMPVHNFFNNVLPAKTGELSFVYFARKSKVRIIKGFATLFYARVLDLIAILILFSVAFWFIRDPPAIIVKSYLPIVIVSIILLIGLIIYTFYGEKIKTAYRRIFRRKIKTSKAVIYVYQKISKFIEINKPLKSWKRISALLGISLLVWLCYYIMIYLIISKMDPALAIISVATIIVIITFQNIVAIFPVQGFASIGTFEGIWTLFLISFGITKEVAISSGFAMHAVFLTFIAAYALICYLILRIKFKN